MNFLKKESLIGMMREELEEALLKIGIPQRHVRMRTSQIWKWIYVRGIRDFQGMSDI
nr:23S rRNA (adenine(2503)-C(2))-methyltransferase RlmN [Candidatus Liberibacter asiaticus]